VWADRGRRAEVRFVGRSSEPSLAQGSRAEVLAAVVAGEPEPPAGPAAARQVHGATVLAPPAGVADTAGAARTAGAAHTAGAADTAGGPIACGEGDALVTDRAGLALSVITADCVPVLVEAGAQVAAVHAGWRGLVAGVLAATAERLAAGGAPPAAEWIAWIGPTIGACCYEVDEDVAARVAEASSPAVVSRPNSSSGSLGSSSSLGSSNSAGSSSSLGSSSSAGNAAKPHLDLVAAARHQLAGLGVADVRTVAVCTRCEPDLLWSYRRLGRRAGRNHAFIWKRRSPR
jgi:YfiH family protein